MLTQNLTHSYHLSVHDDHVPLDLMSEVYQHLLDSEYCVNFYDQPHSNWYPRHDRWVTPRNLPAAPRCPMAWDETSLAHRHPVISRLWLTINQGLGNRYQINGVPEGMNYMTGISPVQAITRPDGTAGREGIGWRVYGDGQEHEFRARTKAIHRDSIWLDRDDYYTLVYFANTQWHPQFYGETIFHSNDADTGDYTGQFEQDQPRNYPIGDIENVVAPRAGRFMLFDSRYLHQIKSVAMYAPENLLAISFRIQRKPTE
jgi:hypothetical protein